MEMVWDGLDVVEFPLVISGLNKQVVFVCSAAYLRYI